MLKEALARGRFGGLELCWVAYEAHKANSFVMHMKNTSYFNSTLLYRQSCEEQEAGAALLRSKTQKNDQKAGN